MYGCLRIAVAELSLHEINNQSLEDYGFQERVDLGRCCLPSSSADIRLTDYCQIKYRVESK